MYSVTCNGVSSFCDGSSGCRHSIQTICVALFFLLALENHPERFARRRCDEVRCSCGAEQLQGKLLLSPEMTSAVRAQRGV